MRWRAASMSAIIWRACAGRARSRSRPTTSESPPPDSSSNWTSPGSRSSMSEAASPSSRSAEPRSLARSSRSSSRWPSRNLTSNGEAAGRLAGSVALAGSAALAGSVALVGSAALAGAFLAGPWGGAGAGPALGVSFPASTLAGAFLAAAAAGAALAASFLAGTDFFGAGLAISDGSFRADGVGGCYAPGRAPSTASRAARAARAGGGEEPLGGGVGVAGVEAPEAEALGAAGGARYESDVGRREPELGGEELDEGAVGPPVGRRCRDPHLHGVTVAPRDGRAAGPGRRLHAQHHGTVLHVVENRHVAHARSTSTSTSPAASPSAATSAASVASTSSATKPRNGSS